MIQEKSYEWKRKKIGSSHASINRISGNTTRFIELTQLIKKKKKLTVDSQKYKPAQSGRKLS